MKTAKQTTGAAKSYPGQLSLWTLLSRLYDRQMYGGALWHKIEPSEAYAAKRLASLSLLVWSVDRAAASLTVSGMQQGQAAKARLLNREQDIARKKEAGERAGLLRRMKRPIRVDFFPPEVRRSLPGWFSLGSFVNADTLFHMYYSVEMSFRIRSTVLHSDKILLSNVRSSPSAFYQAMRASLGPNWEQRLATYPTVPPLDGAT